MIIDCHTRIWQTPAQWGEGPLGEAAKPAIGPRSALPPQADTASHLLASEPVDKSLVLGFRSRHLGTGIPNEFVADFCREHADRMIGFAGIDPTEPTAQEQLHHAVHTLHLHGLTLCPAAQDFHPADTRAMEIYEKATALRLPIVFLAGTHRSPKTRLDYARPHLLDEVARSFPTLKLVIAHLGYPWIDETLVLLSKHPNVYADVACLLRRPWMAYDALVRAHQWQVMDKLLFGSDFPFGTAADGIETLYSLNQVAHGTQMPMIPRESLRGIVERDAIKLLGISTAGARLVAMLPKQRRVQRAG